MQLLPGSKRGRPLAGWVERRRKREADEASERRFELFLEQLGSSWGKQDIKRARGEGGQED